MYREDQENSENNKNSSNLLNYKCLLEMVFTISLEVDPTRR